MASWSEEAARAYFESGGVVTPAAGGTCADLSGACADPSCHVADELAVMSTDDDDARKGACSSTLPDPMPSSASVEELSAMSAKELRVRLDGAGAAALESF